YGREDVNEENIVESFRAFMFEGKAGVDEELGRLVAQAFLADVEEMVGVLEGVESRMYSASILFVFEGDGEQLRKAMEDASNPPPAKEANGDDGSDEDSDEEDDGPRIYAAKLIDFAHAEYTPGQGPDENSLKGIRSCARILRELARGEGQGEARVKENGARKEVAVDTKSAGGEDVKTVTEVEV
ncbi:MAG: inositol polyphosphate kinase family protein, partial [Leuconostoc sp.]|nr:inositol polyphosphate kinase family protein [Leuconostoc sp.]